MWHPKREVCAVCANIEPSWQTRKSALDAADDGLGPYHFWDLMDEAEQKVQQLLWLSFKEWALSYLGQSISLACADGILLDNSAHWSFHGYVAGSKAMNNQVGAKVRRLTEKLDRLRTQK